MPVDPPRPREPARDAAFAPPLAVDRLRRLTLRRGEHPRAQPHLGAASGLVCAHGRVYAIGDDEHHLAVWRDRTGAGRLHRLLPGDLPAGKGARKKRKADFETLARLPGDGGLLALGSGSRPNRERGVHVALDAAGAPRRDARPFDLAPLYDPLRRRLGELNVEGAFVCGDRLVLLNRGHRRGSANVAAAYGLDVVTGLLAGTLRATRPLSLRSYALGCFGGVPLGFTDGAALPGGGWVFSAVAEDSDSSYTDAACAGAVVGTVAADGSLGALRRLPQPDKVEGVDVQRRGRGLALFMVTDADDPDEAAWLLSARL